MKSKYGCGSPYVHVNGTCPQCVGDTAFSHAPRPLSKRERLEKLEAINDKRDCENCLNRCMDMDMDPYCSVVNKPWGQVLYRGVPKECGDDRKLFKIDTRASKQ